MQSSQQNAHLRYPRSNQRCNQHDHVRYPQQVASFPQTRPNIYYETLGLGAQYANLQAVSYGAGQTAGHDVDDLDFFQEDISLDDGPTLMQPVTFQDNTHRNSFSFPSGSYGQGYTEPYNAWAIPGTPAANHGFRFSGTELVNQDSLEPHQQWETPDIVYDQWRRETVDLNYQAPGGFDTLGLPVNAAHHSRDRPSIDTTPSLMWMNSPSEVDHSPNVQPDSVLFSPNPISYNDLSPNTEDWPFRSSVGSTSALLGLSSPEIHVNQESKYLEIGTPYHTKFVDPSLLQYNEAISGLSPNGDNSQIQGHQYGLQVQAPKPDYLQDHVWSTNLPRAGELTTHQAQGEETQKSLVEAADPTWSCFVFEDGSGAPVKSELPPRKGVRNGPLPIKNRIQTANTRKLGIVCSRCRALRIKCDGGNPCNTCARVAQKMILDFPCMKANFADIVESGTCNYISQRAINHFIPDESARVQMFLPAEFDVNQLMGLLESRRNKFHIRARQGPEQLYVLDFARCYEFLKRVGKQRRQTQQGDLRTFIDDTLVKTDSSNPWASCVKDCDPTKEITLLLSKWNNMPSRASYDIVPLSPNGPARPLDPRSEADKQEILIAAQISRIICRKLELDGYKALQTAINKLHKESLPLAEKLAFVQQLGRLLCSLRWRMSWWELLGDGSASHDPFRDRFVERVRILSRILYFYYFAAKAKLPPWNALEVRGHLAGLWNMYPDAGRTVWDDFPLLGTIQGFEEWLERGKDMIREADVLGRFSR